MFDAIINSDIQHLLIILITKLTLLVSVLQPTTVNFNIPKAVIVGESANTGIVYNTPSVINNGDCSNSIKDVFTKEVLEKNRRSILLDISKKRIYLYKGTDQKDAFDLVLVTHRCINVGTPIGLFKVKNKKHNTVFKKNNVKYHYVINFGNDFIIHGVPINMKKNRNVMELKHSCIELYKNDIKKVFSFAIQDTPIFVINKKNKEGIITQDINSLDTVRSKEFIATNIKNSEMYLSKDIDNRLEFGDFYKDFRSINISKYGTLREVNKILTDVVSNHKMLLRHITREKLNEYKNSGAYIFLKKNHLLGGKLVGFYAGKVNDNKLFSVLIKTDIINKKAPMIFTVFNTRSSKNDLQTLYDTFIKGAIVNYLCNRTN